MGVCAPGVPPSRSTNELGCQANGGARAGRAPPRSANVDAHVKTAKAFQVNKLTDT